ncbi:hypothetical protein ES695_02445 [Candidatus Atribacteria bacterium 1244-E10-H5-B2]|nr:MAG: hypothetical protein ES695_02445 [Candidatus Atribacteria bacterium 1244-E10-H5-B2]
MIKQFRYDCSNPKSLEELEFIIEKGKEITYNTFKKYINPFFIKDFNSQVGLPLSKEPYVRFYKSRTPDGKMVYYFEHSAIEYVFY